MSETCKFCGTGVRRDAYSLANDDYHLQRWLCGSAERAGGKIKRGETCYEVELAALRSQLAAESQLKEAAEAREEGLLQHLQHLVDDLDGMCPDSIWQGWWDKTDALLAPAAEEGAGDGK